MANGRLTKILVILVLFLIRHLIEYYLDLWKTRGRKCDRLKLPSNLIEIVSDESLAERTDAWYTCKKGYELSGPTFKECTNGRWVPEEVQKCRKWENFLEIPNPTSLF